MPRTTVSLWALLLLLAAPGVGRLSIETSTDSVLSRADPAWFFYQESTSEFGGDEIVVVALEGDEPFAPETLADVSRLSRRLAYAPGLRRLDSISTFPVARIGPSGELLFDPVLRAEAPSVLLDEKARQALLSDPLIRGNLVSGSGQTLAINLLMRSLGADADRAVVEAVRAEIGPSKAWVSGGPVFRTEANRLTRREILIYVPATILSIAGILTVIFGAVRAAGIALGASAVGSYCSIAAMGYFGAPLTIGTMILPSTFLALGCAYSMHILVAAARGGGNALDERLAEVARPICLSGITTAVGFLSMTFVRIEVIATVGLFGALGASVLVIAALSLVPSLLRLFPIHTRAPVLSDSLRTQVASWLAEGAVRWRWFISISSVGILAFALVGVWRLNVETDVITWFPVGTLIRDDYLAIRERLSGISPMNIVVEAPDGSKVTSPEVIRSIDALTRYVETMPEVGKAVSIGDSVRQLHQQLDAGGEGKLPVADELIDQYLLLLGSVQHFRDLVSDDGLSANVIIRANNNGSDDLLKIAERVDSWWENHGVAGGEVRVTGIMFEYARAEREIERGQLRGLAFAVVAIAALMGWIFRSLRVAVVATVPNLLPLVLAFGVMGFAGVSLDAGTVLLGSLILGIAVDDTIHLLFAHDRALHDSVSARSAVSGALASLLPAITYTTLVVAVGFAIFGLSGFTFTRNLGLLTFSFMVICFVADVVLLPALLTICGRVPIGRAVAGAAEMQK